MEETETIQIVHIYMYVYCYAVESSCFSNIQISSINFIYFVYNNISRWINTISRAALVERVRVVRTLSREFAVQNFSTKWKNERLDAWFEKLILKFWELYIYVYEWLRGG